MNRTDCVIISGGEACDLRALPETDYIIACDKGYAYARRAGLRPDAVIGDFDSFTGGETLAREDGIPVLRLPIRKDDTDTMKAARYALESGYKNITIVCALGGRLDHLLANLQTAAYIVKHGGRAKILSDDTEVIVFTAGTERFSRRDGWSLSVFSLSDRCTGVEICGASYDLHDGVLENSFPLGVSNAWKDSSVEIGVKDGVLAVVSARYADGEAIHDEKLPKGQEDRI